MKRIGFLSFGHWTPSPQSQTRSAAAAAAAEALGIHDLGARWKV
jgi:hypothetical protein